MRNIFALHMIPVDVKKGSGRRKTDYENRCKGNVGATPPVCIYSVIFFPKGLHEVIQSMVLYSYMIRYAANVIWTKLTQHIKLVTI